MNRPVLIEPFDTPSPDPSRLGGKGASLCRLVGFGQRVPSGFVVTVDAFTETLAHLGLLPAFEELSAALGGTEELGPLGHWTELLVVGQSPSGSTEPRMRHGDLRVDDKRSRAITADYTRPWGARAASALSDRRGRSLARGWDRL